MLSNLFVAARNNLLASLMEDAVMLYSTGITDCISITKPLPLSFRGIPLHNDGMLPHSDDNARVRHSVHIQQHTHCIWQHMAGTAMLHFLHPLPSTGLWPYTQPHIRERAKYKAKGS